MERDRMVADNLKKFSKLFHLLQPMQFRDLMSAVEEKFFGNLIEIKATKGDTGIVYLADLMMTFTMPNYP